MLVNRQYKLCGINSLSLESKEELLEKKYHVIVCRSNGKHWFVLLKFEGKESELFQSSEIGWRNIGEAILYVEENYIKADSITIETKRGIN